MYTTNVDIILLEIMKIKTQETLFKAYQNIVEMTEEIEMRLHQTSNTTITSLRNITTQNSASYGLILHCIILCL